MKPYLLVMAGGAVGAALRFQLARALPLSSGGWPWPTFVANLLGFPEKTYFESKPGAEEPPKVEF
jgi:fluoride ion exporter CrcB/FEX